MLGILILTYFLGVSFYKMVYYIAEFLFKYIMIKWKRFYRRFKDKAKMITI
jgi:hypothetical protein